MSERSSADTHIKVGNIKNSTGVAIGKGAQASVNQPPAAGQDEIGERLADLVRLLEFYRDYVEDADGVQQTVTAAQAEVAQSSPRWQAVRRMVEAVAASVAGVAALSEAINNIQSLVARLTG